MKLKMDGRENTKVVEIMEHFCFHFLTIKYYGN